jgi:hypothetical protein
VARSLSTPSRFVLAYLALAALGGAALGGFIVFVKRPGPKPPTPWSQWQPASASSVGGTVQAIATHIAGSYRLSDGRKLTRVVTSAPTQSASNFEAIALADRPGSVTVYPSFGTILFTLCGTAGNCRVEGESVAHGDVLRREALELALYTLKYSKAADVAVFFPPDQGQNKSANVLFFPREDFAEELARPLRATLPHARAAGAGKIDARELQTIDELTGGRRFHFGVQKVNGRRVLVLQPVA